MRTVMVYLCIFVGCIVLVSGYGCWPRPERHPEPEVMVAQANPAEVLMEEPIAPGDPDNVYAGQQYGGFADNFDYANEELEEALDAIQLVENRKGDPEAVGDQHLTHRAYGLYQIRQPYLDDVNRIVGPKRMKAAWGKGKLSIEDMKDGRKARWAATEYLEHYGHKYRLKTGKEPDAGVYARMHNGGPNGWRKASTNDYMYDVLKEME